MGISSTGDGERDPAVIRTGGGRGSADRPAPTGRSGGGAAGDRGAGGAKGGGAAGRPRGGKKPIKPVTAADDRPWGPIALFAAVGLLAAAVIGFGVYAAARSDDEVTAADIRGLTNYRETRPELVTAGDHKPGPIAYDVRPPVGGPHNALWQNCVGEVYAAPVASEHVVHSMEHGAVWITYRPDLPPDQVDTLAAKVRNRDRMILSPFPGLDAPISMQAWGYQLTLDDAGDERVNQFIKAFRIKAAVENAPCAEGVTTTGTTPVDLPTGG